MPLTDADCTVNDYEKLSYVINRDSYLSIVILVFFIRSPVYI